MFNLVANRRHSVACSVWYISDCVRHAWYLQAGMIGKLEVVK